MESGTKYVLERTLGEALDNTLGAVLVSVIASASLFGILTTQCYYYALRFKQDPRWLKCIVVALWIIDGTHQITVCAIIFQYSVEHYGDLHYVRRSIWPVSFCIMLEPLPALIVQMYFTRRLYYLNQKLWPIAACTAILSIATFALGEICASITVCDIAVTIPVAWTLHTSRTGFRQTDALIVKLILWTVNTGALPASCALLEAVMFILKNETLIHLAANIVLAKLYSNTLLAFLNRRGTLTKGGALHFSDHIALSLPHQGSQGDHYQEPSRKTGPLSFPSFKKKPAGLKVKKG
ncbi:hypothetical protein BS47DRAFT_1093502 [Hydnum rufescens UP504]|uniref:DUF6534 domain-containing protein n=1 Tax=Hydnum rufescens UP504 TaxID=1448309 RepID=A0A9P6DV50_9AGAM|nr:hypothetical protein BS47DRAFT_1093502 [Hydnum rufescens UP504]